MIEERIIISDSNIFFDLISVDLLKDFFKLPCKIATTDFVINEIIKSDQQKKIGSYIDSKQLHVEGFEANELLEIISIYQSTDNNVSLTDCSVWYYAKKTQGRMLTGDAKLRRVASEDNVKVSGFLFILDNLIEYGILSRCECADKLKQLIEINSRLPKKECEERIKLWGLWCQPR